MRLIDVLFACASSDVSRKELQSCTKQKEVQIEIKMAPKKSIYFASKSQISDEINSCSFCMCILRCFSERASKQHTTKGSSKRNKKCQSGPKKVLILPHIPKFLMRAIQVFIQGQILSQIWMIFWGENLKRAFLHSAFSNYSLNGHKHL